MAKTARKVGFTDVLAVSKKDEKKLRRENVYNENLSPKGAILLEKNLLKSFVKVKLRSIFASHSRRGG